MNWRQTFGWLAVLAVAASSASAQEAGFAASAVANDNGTTTIILGPGGGTAFTVTGSVKFGDNAAAAAKATYLGVATSSPPEPLVDQLKLPKGVGLLVEFVDAKGPAAAGIRKNDVLTKLDDQLLTSPQHLAALVQMHKPKDKVVLALIREAQEQKLTVELGESEEAAQEPMANLLIPLNAPPNVAQMFANMNGARRAAASGMSSFSDGEHSLTVTTNGREKHLVAKDRDGKVLFDGSVTTEQQRKQVPPEILKKFQTMERSMRVQVGGDVAQAVAVMGGGGIAFGNAGGIPFMARGFGQPSGQSRTWSDNEHNLTVTTRDRGKFLAVDNKNGQILWQGFIQTDEQRKAVPPEYLPKLEKLEAKVREESRGVVSLIEDGLTITLTTEAGKQTVVAKNAEGNVIFDGPVDTEDQRAKMPEKVRTKLEKLWKSCVVVWQSAQD